MNAHQKKHRKKKRNSLFRKWHRRIGFTVSLFLLNLSVTGFLLNHYEFFGFHHKTIQSNLILNWYGISAPESANCFSDKRNHICELDQHIYLNQQFWKKTDSRLLNVVSNSDGLVLATMQSLYFLSRNLDLIDEISITESINEQALSLSFENSQLIINTVQGHNFSLDLQTFEWIKLSSQNMPQPDNSLSEVTVVQKTKQTNIASLQSDYRKRQITLLHFIQDMHSGRILMASGILINDITAFAVFLLAISGLITWQRRKKKENVTEQHSI